MIIDLVENAHITSLSIINAFTNTLVKYSDFINIFSKELAIKLYYSLR